MLKNGQTYFKNFAVWKLQRSCEFVFYALAACGHYFVQYKFI